ncbi:MAG: PIN domain-containing protein [Proteobacteria bacterium]|nr:PIN domain-containing protein [Pseudomonadota bacterium]
MNEFSSVLIKHQGDNETIHNLVGAIGEECQIGIINLETINQAWNIRKKYSFSIWDSLIVASAIENNCSILYTEDLQHEQTIDGSLKIANPFIEL